MNTRRRWPTLLLVLTALLAAGCSGGGPLAPPTVEVAERLELPPPPERSPAGRVVVAYPEEPAVWYPGLLREPAAVDLAALWGLPLYRIDGAGQLRPALAEDAVVTVGDGEAGDGWSVQVRLRNGAWSDGTPVTAEDVVATVVALQGEAQTAPAFAAVTSITAVDARTVRLTFDGPYGRWPYLLADGWSVLPASVLAERGLEAYRSVPEVTGGPFRIATYEPGRRVVFRAHHQAAEGAPALEEIEVGFVPDVETAFGLLERGEAQVGLGYLALNPVGRAEEVDGVVAAAPLGGTTVSLRWRAGGALGGASRTDRRRAVRDGVDVQPQVEGLLPDIAEVARSLFPGDPGPWGRDTPARSLEGVSPSILVPRGQEAPAFTARSIQRDLRSLGGGAELIRLEPDEVATATQGDAVLEVSRRLPWPSLPLLVTSGDTDQLRELAHAADRAATPDAREVDAFLELAYEEGHVLPLYRVAVTHVWRPEVRGVEPSSWPGLGFWNAHTWRVEAQG